jgi:drug/metabolite transporter (DMT)-like permease
MHIHALLLFACFLWAISFIATKTALQSAPPLTIVSIRLIAAALCFLPFLYRARVALFSGGWDRARKLFILSLFGTGIHYGTQTIGIGHTTASNASLWPITCPIFIMLISALFLGERISTKKGIGTAIAVAGVLVVMGPDFFRGVELKTHVMGDGLVFVSIFLWALFTVYGKQLQAELGALPLLGAATMIGAIWMLPVGLWEVRHTGFSLSAITPQAWGAILFLGVGCGFLASLLYFLCLEKTESQKVGVYLYTIPPMTYVLAALLLGETIGAGLISGSLLVAAGVFLTERG